MTPPRGPDAALAEEPAASLTVLAPGLAVTAAATLAAGYLTDHYGAPLTLMALLIGLALNFLGAEPRLAPGLAFASRTLLRVGIVMLGARVTGEQIAGLGLPAFAAVVVIAGTTIGVGVIVARALGCGAAFGALAGGATAICGASAALAFATLLGDRRIGEAKLGLVLVGISAMSAAAMFAYPILARMLGLGDAAAGFVMGASIHDVAQALGAGFSFSPEAGEAASVVKLTRVALLAPALAVMSMFLGDAGTRRIELPWFVLGFFALAATTSLVAVPPAVVDGAGAAAAWLLAAAVAATGMRSPMHALLESGWRPLLVMLTATLAALGLALGAAALLFP